MPALSTTYSGELHGIRARLVEVEVDMHVGLHSFTIVGLADKAVGEARERVNSALKNSGFKPPNRENRRITVNLAPAVWRKTGAQYDLAIAVAYLAATKQIAWRPNRETILVGELALDGRVRAVGGVLNIACMAKENNFRAVVVPEGQAGEVSAVCAVAAVAVRTLRETIDILEQRAEPRAEPRGVRRGNDGVSGGDGESSGESASYAHQHMPNFSDVKGQPSAKRALTIAATGMHNILMSGPPGAGKTTLARAFPGILPSLTAQEALEVMQIKNAVGEPVHVAAARPPFRAPHHTATLMAIVGGGAPLKPGEITRAHRGVLFLDELPEFSAQTLESMREPLEAGEVQVTRVRERTALPARFILIAAMNPCRCGYYGDGEKRCRCEMSDVLRYRKKISGPLLDRIDMHVALPRVPIKELRMSRERGGESGPWTDGADGCGTDETAVIRELVARARKFREARIGKGAPDLSSDARRFLRALDQSDLSARGYARLLCVARTIADLEGSEKIEEAHLAEAFQYRYRPP